MSIVSSNRKKKIVAMALAMAAGVSAFNSEQAFAEEQNQTAVSEEAQQQTATTEADAVQTADAQAEAKEVVDENDSRYKWMSARPTDDMVNEAAKEVLGKTIVSVDIKGVSEDIEKSAKVAVRSNPGDMLSPKLIERDLNRLYDTGYFYDLYPSFTTTPDGVAVTYNVLETPILTSIEIEGNTEIESTEKLMNKLTLKTGQRLNRRILHENLTGIQQIYVDDGYIMAKVNDLDVKDDGKLVIRVNEGILEGFKVKGNTKTKEKVILREMRCKVGKPLNKNEVTRSYQRINNLQFFESVDVRPVPGVEPNAVVLEVDVKEKNTGSFTIGAGYSSSDGFVGMVGVGDRNFRGTGDSINVNYEFGGNDNDSRGWSFGYRHPWLDKKETSVAFKIFNRTYEYDDYNTNGDLVEEFMRKRTGFEITFGRPQTEYTSNYITLRHVDDQYKKHKGNKRDRSQDWDWRRKNFGITRSITFDHVTDTRDNYMYPMNGKRTNLSVEYAGLGGDFTYQKYNIAESRFYQVGHVQVVAVRGEWGYSPQRLPESAQYKVGGQNTIRGYRDDQFRGHGMVIGNVEYRFPLSKMIKGALFTDFGTAWQESGFRPRGFHGSYGAGISLETPIGPLRFDIGHGSQGNRVHFTVGNTF